MNAARLNGAPLTLPTPAVPGSDRIGLWMGLALAGVLVGMVFASPSMAQLATKGRYGNAAPVTAQGWRQRRSVGYWSLAAHCYRLRLHRLAHWLAHRSIKTWSAFARPHLTLGDVALHRGRIQDAHRHYAQALDRLQDAQSRGIPLAGMVRCALRQGTPHAAMEWLRRTESANPAAAREVACDPAWADNVSPLVRRLRSERLPTP